MPTTEQRLTVEEVREIGQERKLLPTEADFRGRKGYWRQPKLVRYEDGTVAPDPSGAYEWGFRYRPNVNGKKTGTQHEVEQRMAPFSRSAVERSRQRNRSDGYTLLKDQEGSVRSVPPALADVAAHNNGWSHHWRARGVRVESGPEGMLWRCVGGAWEATGLRCLGQPLWGSRYVPRRGIQHDPDGNPWRFVAGEWRRLG